MANTKALTVKQETVDAVSRRIANLQNQGEIHFPADYSPQNALKQAWLILQGVQDKDHRPALQVCTKESIMNALLDMVIQGLNPTKAQMYFICYGSQLSCQRSYFGDMALVQRVNPNILDDGFSYAAVYEGDDLVFEIRRGKRVVSSHKQKLENINSGKLKAAYCEIYDKNDRLINSALMTLNQIKASWKQSKTNPIDEKGNIKASSTHGKFTEEMAVRTVVRKACKPIINSSSDKTLMEAVNRSEFIEAEEAAQEEVEQHANQEFVDVQPEPESEPEPEPENGQEPSSEDEGLERIIEGDEQGQATGTDGPDF